MAYKNKEDALAYGRKYHELNKEKRHIANREYHKAHKKEINERKRKYYADNPDKAWINKPGNKEKQLEYYKAHRKEDDAYHIKYRYKIPAKYKELMFEEQSGMCAICGKFLDKPYIDHDHKTGIVRGLLCRECNLLLGYAGDNPIILYSAINYLSNNRSII
jgi:hypothetical protein